MPERVRLGIYFAAMIALIVSGCIFTRPKKAPLTLRLPNIAKLPELLSRHKTWGVR